MPISLSRLMPVTMSRAQLNASCDSLSSGSHRLIPAAHTAPKSRQDFFQCRFPLVDVGRATRIDRETHLPHQHLNGKQDGPDRVIVFGHLIICLHTACPAQLRQERFEKHAGISVLTDAAIFIFQSRSLLPIRLLRRHCGFGHSHLLFPGHALRNAVRGVGRIVMRVLALFLIGLHCFCVFQPPVAPVCRKINMILHPRCVGEDPCDFVFTLMEPLDAAAVGAQRTACQVVRRPMGHNDDNFIADLGSRQHGIG